MANPANGRWLADEGFDQESVLATARSDNRRKAAGRALTSQRPRAAHLRARAWPTTDHARDLGPSRRSRERVRQIEVRAFEKVQKG